MGKLASLLKASEVEVPVSPTDTAGRPGFSSLRRMLVLMQNVQDHPGGWCLSESSQRTFLQEYKSVEVLLSTRLEILVGGTPAERQ
jgi:hypothetical protein